MHPGPERWFAIASALALLLSAVALVTAPGTASRDSGITFDPDVPTEYRFTVPDRPGEATVDGESFASIERALDAAEPGDTIRLKGRFTVEGNVTVNTSGVTLSGPSPASTVIDGPGEGDVLRIEAPNVRVESVWVRDSGYDPSGNDAGIWVAGRNATIVDSRITEITFGIWVNGVGSVTIRNNTIVGRERITPLTNRGNGIQLWQTTDSLVAGNRITDVRDGIYYSWSEEVTARRNVMWDLRYGVHYMYSDNCLLANNTAFNNDVGYALMVSEHLHIVNNTAVNNTGRSGHGILVKSIDHTTIRGNVLIGNEKGLYVYNSLDNTIAGNLVLANDLGVYLAAGSVRERVYGNSFVRNGRPVAAVIGQQVAWNASERGNYWSGARPSDVDHDGVNEIPYRPAGIVDHLTRKHPDAAIFTNSPAFDVIRLAQATLPVIESPGVIDHHPLARSPHDWRRYYQEPTDTTEGDEP